MRNYRFTISKRAEIMSDNICDEYVSEILKRKDYIHDINVTCKMEPFTEDAHGVVMMSEDNKAHVEQMLYVQQKTGVPISLVFNNIYVPNDTYHLNIFLENFYELYEKGVRSVTLPHILWMKQNIIQETFPDLHVKSTVLRRVRNGQEFWNYALAGFNCVNVDRLLYRDSEALNEIRRAQKKYYEIYGKYVYISMVIDENCIGYCPFWEEHYQHSMTSKQCKNPLTNKEGFSFPTAYSGCKEKDKLSLQRVSLIAFKEDLDNVFEKVDILKIGGRRFKVETFKLIDSIVNNDLESHPLLHRILVRGDSEELKLLEAWRKKTQRCRYQCWECDLCNKMDAIILKSRIQEWKYNIHKF